MTSDHEDASQLSDPLRRARTHLVDRSAVTRLMEEVQRNSIAYALETAQQQSIFATMQAIESPSTRIARGLADIDRLGAASAMRERLAMHTRHFDRVNEVARLTSIAIGNAARPWQPAIAEIARVADRAAHGLRSWQEQYAERHVAEAMRRFESNIGSARHLATQFSERLAFASQLTETEAFRSWLSETSNERMHDRIERLLEDATEAEQDPQLDAAHMQSVEAETAASLLSWLVEWLAALRSSGLPHAERMAALGIALTVVCFLYNEISSSRDHAEHMAKIDAQSGVLSTMLDVQTRGADQAAAFTRAILALETADRTYQIRVRSAPLRAELQGPTTQALQFGEEVQVLQSAGKWRLIQTVDDDGVMIFGWVMNKHLERLKEPD